MDEYFSIQIDRDGCLLSLPVLLRDYVPNMDKLPEFILRLGSHVDWDSEKDCFQSLSLELSDFYALGGRKSDSDGLFEQVEHLLCPQLKQLFIGQKIMIEDKIAVQLADLPDLYKVFERC